MLFSFQDVVIFRRFGLYCITRCCVCQPLFSQHDAFQHHARILNAFFGVLLQKRKFHARRMEIYGIFLRDPKIKMYI
jgi:hypothetical protein